MAAESDAQPREGRHASPSPHRGGLLTLLFTDVVGSTALKQQLGDRAGVELLQEHHRLVRQTLSQFAGAEEVLLAGDSFLVLFPMPSEAVKCALALQGRLRQFNQGRAAPVQDRFGLHLGEVVIEETGPGQRNVHGMQVDTCARVMSLAQPAQILLTRPVFDNARQSLKGEEIEGAGPLTWLNHGRFELKGVGEPVEICEVRAADAGPLSPPTTSEKARHLPDETETVLGWRPAIGGSVPNTKWVLEQKLGEGGFGEVWLGRHQTLKTERRVFKFCFRADRVRSLKREMTLFRLLKERMGDHPNIVRLLEVYFDQPPYYVEMDYAPGQDLQAWCQGQGGADKPPLDTRLEIVAQIADALQAAHDAGVIHRDVKPANILVGSPKPEARGPRSLEAKLTDFGIGQVISEEYLAGVTRAGFTQTILADSSSSKTGTQLYMAPELLAGKPASIRSDIYSLGVVLYQLLVADFTRPVTTDWADDVSDPLLREDLKRCFAGNPAERFAGAGQLADNLRSLPARQRRRQEGLMLARRAAQRHRVAVISSAAAAALLVLATALGYGFWRTQQARNLAEANAYAADMNEAQQALLAYDLGKARTLLARYRPGSGREHLRGFEWRFLAAESNSEYAATNASSNDSVFRTALSPDGRTLAVGRYGGTVELWDPASLARTATLETNVAFAAVAFSPTGRLLAASAPRGGIRLWQLDPPRVVGELAHTNYANRLSFSPDGRYLASSHPESGVCVWDLETRQTVRRYLDFHFQGEEHGGPISFSPDGGHLAVGDASGRIRILDWAADRVLVDIPAHQQEIMSLAYSPDGKLLASGSGFSAEDIRLWNPATGQPAGSLAGHRNWICVLQFSGDGSRLLSGSADQTIGVWDVSARRLILKLRGHLDEVWSLAFDERRTSLITGCKDGTLARWDIDKVRPRALRLDLPGRLRRPGYAASGPSVAVLDQQGAVALWRPGDPQQLSVIPALGTNNAALATAPGRGLLACATREGLVRIWSLQSANLVTSLGGHARPASGLLFSKQENSLVAWSPWNAPGLVTIWDAKTWAKRASFAERNAARSAALSPDGRLLVLGLAEGRLAWWDAARGQRLDETPCHRHWVVGLGFSPDGSVLASTSDDGTVALWDTRTRRRTAYWKGHFLGLHAVAFSPDGRRLATALSGGSAARLWDFRTRRELLTLDAPGGLFYWIKFSPDGAALLCGSDDAHCYLWRVPSFAELDAPH